MADHSLVCVTCTTCTRVHVHWDMEEQQHWLLEHTQEPRAGSPLCPSSDRRWQRKDAWSEVLRECPSPGARALFPITYVAWGVVRSVPLDVPPA